MKIPTYKVKLSGVNKGCRFNNMLLARAQRFLLGNGHRVVQNARDADYILVHSCGTFDRFKQESLSLSRSYSQESRAKVIIIGCLDKIHREVPQQNPDLQFLGSPEDLDLFFARQRKIAEFSGFSCQSVIDQTFAYPPQKLRRITEKLDNAKNHLLCQLLPENSYLLKILREIKRNDKHFVEISRGCIGNCTYCIEKRVNPRVTSRPIAAILSDIAQFYRPGLKLCLAADDCGAYGIDINETLFSLHTAIQEHFPGLDIELCNLYPYWLETYENEFLDLVQGSHVTSINIPLQSGSQRILELMKRRYSLANVLRIIQNIKAVSPNIMIWSHFIVGFPGETPEDFRRSLDLIKEFDFCFWFPYSKVGGTPSSQMDGQISSWIKQLRSARFRAHYYALFLRRFQQELASSATGRH